MQWLTDIFVGVSDQARLVTTILAAMIAIAVVLVNQWFNSRRSRNHKIIDKIEEIYLSVIKMEDAASAVHHEIMTNYEKYKVENSDNQEYMFYKEEKIEDKLIVGELNYNFFQSESVAKMLSGLYFPILKNEIKKYKNSYFQSYLSFLESESIGEYMDVFELEKSIMKEALEKIYNMLSDIMEKKLR